ncbi:MAG: fibrillarin-like rRNA/tRNA 2'-O-methyltransferase [Thermoplasmatota archaeon]
MNWDGVFRLEDGRIATQNLAPGKRVYEEDLFFIGDREFRTWDPTRSKLGAYLLKGGRIWPFTPQSRVLYLGAANGTTPSHVSDIAREGLVVSVEFSPRSFRDLYVVAESRPNLIPILADAWNPGAYSAMAGAPEILYQDIAQRNQARILAKNVNVFRPTTVYFMIKPRSINVAGDPREVARVAADEVAALTGYALVDMVDLGPFERDHSCAVFQPGGRISPVREPGMRPDRRDDWRREGPRDDRRPFRREGGGGPPRQGGGGRGGFQGRPPWQGGGERGRGGGFRSGPDRGGERRGSYPPRESGGGPERGGPPGGGYNRGERSGGDSADRGRGSFEKDRKRKGGFRR